jgi:hypothetical protein
MSCDRCDCAETPNVDAMAERKFKVSGVLKDKTWDPEIERYLFVRNENVVASKSKEVEFEDVNYWNISSFVNLAYDTCPFSKVTIELV